jgi:hypothetical protein
MGYYTKQGNYIDYPTKQPSVKTQTGSIPTNVGHPGFKGSNVRNTEHSKLIINGIKVDGKVRGMFENVGKWIYYSNEPYKANEYIVDIDPNSDTYGYVHFNRFKTGKRILSNFRKVILID